MVKSLFQALRSRVGQSKYLLLREAKARAGTFRQQEELGLLPRPNYAYGMLRAADLRGTWAEASHDLRVRRRHRERADRNDRPRRAP